MSEPRSGMDFSHLTHYELLGVDSDATTEEVKRAYREVIKDFHTDHKRSTQWKRFFQEQTKNLNNARDVLCDPAKRADYDKKLARTGGQRRDDAGRGEEAHQREQEEQRRRKLEDAAVVECFKQAVAAHNAHRFDDSKRLYFQVLQQFDRLQGTPTFEAQASAADSLFHLGNLARNANRTSDAQRYFTESAAAYEALASRPDVKLTDRAAKARKRAAVARDNAKALYRLDHRNLPPATEVITLPGQPVHWGGYTVQMLYGTINVDADDGTSHQFRINALPANAFTTLKKRTGEPMPIHVCWNGVALTVHFDPAPTTALLRMEARESEEREFATVLGEVYRHPEGGISVKVEHQVLLPPTIWITVGIIRTIQYPFSAFPSGRWTVARDENGKPLPVRLRPEGGRFLGQWLNLNDPSSWHDAELSDAPLGTSSTRLKKFGKVLATSALTVAAEWLRIQEERAQAKDSQTKTDSKPEESNPSP